MHNYIFLFLQNDLQVSKTGLSLHTFKINSKRALVKIKLIMQLDVCLCIYLHCLLCSFFLVLLVAHTNYQFVLHSELLTDKMSAFICVT